MKTRLLSHALIVLLLSATAYGCKQKKETVATTVQYKEIPHATNEKPLNVILLIGDGMGLAQIQAAMLAQQDRLNMQSAQYIGFIDTRSHDNLITDSGAGGTALACGTKTYNGAIGVNADTIPVKSVLVKSAEKGLSTGIVVSCALTHATPASFFAHQPSRDLYKDIANDFYGKNITVGIGGGYENFDVNKLKEEGYEVITEYVNLRNTNASKYVAFYNKDFHPPSVANGRGNFLKESTEKALETLSQNSKGFFLMIEGSQIDWGGHDNNIDYVVSETADFDKTLGAVLNFAAKDGRTLVIVTADHETGGLSILNSSKTPQELKPHFSTKQHSGVFVPVLSWGPGANTFSGFMDNTEVPHKITALLELEP